MENNEQIKYKNDIQRIQDIIAVLNGRDCDIDDMLGLVKEATMLIERCQNKLAHTGIEIDEALKRLETISRPEN
ncbi:MAG: exodeoxyribonuclease VII small subunit [Proteobacteria bacterium]|nr:exodeoxyribonuclease VII small subunit [Pseudomonadota bacterium]